MNVSDSERIGAWLGELGLRGASGTGRLDGFGERCVAAGLELARALVIIDTLHPTYEGRAFRWRNDGVEESSFVEFGRTSQDKQVEDNWRNSTFYQLL